MSKSHKNGKPKPDVAPLSPEVLARFEDWDKLNQWYNEGKLDRYRGEVVVFAGDTIYAHGRTLDKILEKAEKKAQAKGISPVRLLYYFVPRD